MKWLRRLFGPTCEHHWKVIKQYEIYDHYVTKEMPVAVEHVLQCDKCGWIKAVRI